MLTKDEVSTIKALISYLKIKDDYETIIYNEELKVIRKHAIEVYDKILFSNQTKKVVTQQYYHNHKIDELIILTLERLIDSDNYSKLERYM